MQRAACANREQTPRYLDPAHASARSDEVVHEEGHGEGGADHQAQNAPDAKAQRRRGRGREVPRLAEDGEAAEQDEGVLQDAAERQRPHALRPPGLLLGKKPLQGDAGGLARASLHVGLCREDGHGHLAGQREGRAWRPELEGAVDGHGQQRGPGVLLQVEDALLEGQLQVTVCAAGALGRDGDATAPPAHDAHHRLVHRLNRLLPVAAVYRDHACGQAEPPEERVLEEHLLPHVLRRQQADGVHDHEGVQVGGVVVDHDAAGVGAPAPRGAGALYTDLDAGRGEYGARPEEVAEVHRQQAVVHAAVAQHGVQHAQRRDRGQQEAACDRDHHREHQAHVHRQLLREGQLSVPQYQLRPHLQQRREGFRVVRLLCIVPQRGVLGEQRPLQGELRLAATHLDVGLPQGVAGAL
mmetsp:Transcript_3969/g.10732  ORF Transcript_3969/g.10732 Transcript_3969/m.10732 type:complete len:411 (+) Transcript_3969:56-1288(+)